MLAFRNGAPQLLIFLAISAHLGCACTIQPATGPGDCPDGSSCADAASCPPGFQGDGITCADIDECQTSNGGCSPNAACTNTPGSRTCVCKAGFSGDGLSCTDIDECQTNHGGCSPNADCTNTPGSRTCTCKAGFSGDGITCTPSCAPVAAAADSDPWMTRAPGIGFGSIIETAPDVYLQNPSGRLRLGVRRTWGGGVVFWGLSADPNSNTIDANDTGRLLQLAIYDPTRIRQGCAYNASCSAATMTCPASISYLGWNPVQGGDKCNRGAPVLSYGRKGDGLTIRVQPVQWNPDWDRADCTQTGCGTAARPVDVLYDMDYRFVREHVVEIAMQVTSNETFSHPDTAQEFPTLYVSHGAPDLPLLLDAAGTPVALTTPANDGFFVGNFTSPGPWVTWQLPDRLYGVGLATDEGVADFQGWRGDGTTAPYFHNVRPQLAFALGAGQTVRGISYLALGSFTTVKAELEATLAARPPFGHLDAPAAGTTLSFAAGAPIDVAGWVLDTTAIGSVQVEIDGQPAATLATGTARPDVCAVYPAYRGCPQAGFAGQVPTTGLSACAHLLRVTASDGDGNSTVLGERVIQAR